MELVAVPLDTNLLCNTKYTAIDEEYQRRAWILVNSKHSRVRLSGLQGRLA